MAGADSFFGGLAEGLGQGILQREQTQAQERMRTAEQRASLWQLINADQDVTGDLKAYLGEVLFQTPAQETGVKGAAKRIIRGRQPLPDPSQIFKVINEYHRTGKVPDRPVPHGPANAPLQTQDVGPSQGAPPVSTGPLPRTGSMTPRELAAESERARFQGQTDITTRAEAERNRQAFADKKEELLSIPGMTEGSPAYLNALYGVKIQTDRPENMGTVAAELFEKHRTGKITDAQFDEGIKDLQRINSAAKEKPDVPGVDVPFSPEVATQKADIAKAGRSVSSNSLTNNDIKDIADAIEKGDQPPTTQGLYRNAAPVRAELARRGVPIARMEIDWKATQRFLSTLNGPQQVRIQQAIATASDTLDKLDGLYDEWRTLAPTSGFKVLNRAALATMRNLPGRAGAVAQAMEAQIADLTSELAVVYMGGNTPTDHGLKLAHQNLSTDWNEETFKEGVKQARLNLAIRRNSIIHSVPSGISGQYFQQGQGGTGNIPNISSPPPTGGDFFSGFGGVKKQ